MELDQEQLLEARRRRLAFPPLGSNEDINGVKVSRLYEAFEKDKLYIVEPDGSHYSGKISIKKVYRKKYDEVKRHIGGYWVTYYNTANDRWFDNAGMICQEPKQDKLPDDAE